MSPKIDFDIDNMNIKKLKVNPKRQAYAKTNALAADLLDTADERYTEGEILVVGDQKGLDSCVLMCLGPVKVWEPTPHKHRDRIFRITKKFYSIGTVDEIREADPSFIFVREAYLKSVEHLDVPTLVHRANGELDYYEEEETADILGGRSVSISLGQLREYGGLSSEETGSSSSNEEA